MPQVRPVSRRLSLRRDLELAGDVAALLRQAAKAVGIALDLVDMRVALLMQRPEQLAHALEDGGEIGRLLVLGVGALADMDVEPETGEALFGQRLAAGEPVGGIDRFNDDSGDLGILVQDSGGQIADGGSYLGLQRRGFPKARIGNGNEWHDRSPWIGCAL